MRQKISYFSILQACSSANVMTAIWSSAHRFSQTMLVCFFCPNPFFVFFFHTKKILESKYLLLQSQIWSPEVIWILLSINKQCHRHKTWHQNLFFVCVFILTKNIISEPREWQHELHWVLVRTCRWEILQKNISPLTSFKSTGDGCNRTRCTCGGACITTLKGCITSIHDQSGIAGKFYHSSKQL